MSVIEVYRGDGLRPGTPIVETLLSDDALLARGIAEMDRNAHAVNQVEMEVVFRPGLRLGERGKGGAQLLPAGLQGPGSATLVPPGPSGGLGWGKP